MSTPADLRKLHCPCGRWLLDIRGLSVAITGSVTIEKICQGCRERVFITFTSDGTNVARLPKKAKIPIS